MDKKMTLFLIIQLGKLTGKLHLFPNFFSRNSFPKTDRNFTSIFQLLFFKKFLRNRQNFGGSF